MSSANPFIGLRSFDYDDRAHFFGREQQSYALYRLMSFGFIAVVGNSGIGKSSIVRAGLLPLLLRCEERRPWRIAIMTPGADPLGRFGDAIASFATSDEDDAAYDARRERISYLIDRSSSGAAEALGEMPELADCETLVIVDQFEEIFRIEPQAREGPAAFVAQLLQLHRMRPSAHVLITMRSDFIGDCVRFSGLPEAVSATQFLVPSLSRSQRQQAIVEPIVAAGATIDPALVERLLNDAGIANDVLPVLQHALSRTWLAAEERSGADEVPREICEADYREAGTLDGALSLHADAVLADLPGLEAVVEAIFRALSERDAQGRATRRVLAPDALIAETGMPEADVMRVVDRFRAPDCAFLLPGNGALTPATRIDVVHEALLARWEKLSPKDPAERGWLDRESDDAQYYRSLLARIDGGETHLPLDRVEERYAWWTSVPRTAAWAERYGGRIALVENFFANSLVALSETEAERARVKEREVAEASRKRRATARLLAISASAAVGLFALLAITFFALLGSQRTTNESLVAQSKLLGRDAENLTDRGDAASGALLALEGLPQRFDDADRPFNWTAYGALTDALANLREKKTYQLSGALVVVRYSPDGTKFIARQSDGTIYIVRIGAKVPELVLHAQTYAADVEFSADGSRIVIGSTDGSIHIWDARSGRLLRVISAFSLTVENALFSTDGRSIVASSFGDGKTKMFDSTTGRELREIRGSMAYHNAGQPVRDRILTYNGTSVAVWDSRLTRALRVFPSRHALIMAISRDERKVAIGYENRSVVIFDVQTGSPISRTTIDTGPFEDVNFSPDGRWFVTLDHATTRVWNTGTGAFMSEIRHSATLGYWPEFSRDGEFFASPGIDGLIGIYATESGARLVTLADKDDDTDDGDFSLDDRRFITASINDGTVREWDLAGGTPRILDSEVPPDVSYDRENHGVAVSPSGRYVAVVDRRNLRVFDTVTGTAVRSISEPLRRNESVIHAAFSADGKTLMLVGDGLADIQFWDWRRGVPLPTFPREHGPPPRYFRGEFSPDGRSIAASARGIIYLLDAATGRLRATASDNQKTVASVNFSSDGKHLLASSRDGWVRVYDATNGRRLVAFPASTSLGEDARFSPDARLIATASYDRKVRVWNASDGALVASKILDGDTNSVAFSRDGAWILIGADSGVTIWDYRHDRTVVTFRGFAGGIKDAEFALDDRRVVTTGSDLTLRLWTVPEIPVCQAAVDTARRVLPHGLPEDLRATEFVAPRKSPTILNALLPKETCS